MQLSKKYVEDFCVRLAYHLSSAEHPPLSLEDTKLILIDQIIPEKTAVKDFYKIDNVRFVLHYIKKQRRVDKDISFDNLFEIHYLLMNRIDAGRGDFKSEDNKLEGTDFQTASPEETPLLTKQWMDHINMQLNAGVDKQELIELVAEGLVAFEHIHPFEQGNSKTGQLLMIFILLKEKSAPFVVEFGDKSRYNRYIHEQNVKGLVAFLKDKIGKEEIKLEKYKDR